MPNVKIAACALTALCLIATAAAQTSSLDGTYTFSTSQTAHNCPGAFGSFVISGSKVSGDLSEEASPFAKATVVGTIDAATGAVSYTLTAVAGNPPTGARNGQIANGVLVSKITGKNCTVDIAAQRK